MFRKVLFMPALCPVGRGGLGTSHNGGDKGGQ